MANEFGTSFVVHQALHGYRDGHRLLESSIALDPETKNVLLSLSDMSGPSIMPGFETYFTGYPLVEAGLFAFAATWYAPEMERPGCVWTHTLLIELSDLNAVSNNFIALAEQFRRPEVVEGSENYKTQISVSFAPSTGELISPPWNFDQWRASSIFEALYGSDKPVFVAVNDAQSPLPFVLTIWAQQWPALRQNFKFCTGALTPRRLRDVDFDLQFFPMKQKSRFARLDGRTITDEEVLSEEWARLATAELYSLKSSSIRDFFCRFAPPGETRRVIAGKLARVYTALERLKMGGATVAAVLEITAEEFPAESDGELLKKQLIKLIVESRPAAAVENDVELLRSIIVVESRYGTFGSAIGGAIRKLAARIWELNWQLGATVLQDLDQSDDYRVRSLLENVEIAYASVISDDEISELAVEALPLLLRLIRRNKNILTLPSLWRASESAVNGILALLDKDVEDYETILGPALRSVVASGQYNAAYFFLERAPTASVQAILDWMEETSDQTDAARVLNLLMTYDRDVQTWLEVRPIVKSPIALAIVLCVLDYDLKRLRQIEPLRWLPLANAEELWDFDVFIRSKAVLLALALTLPEIGVELACGSFYPVYREINHERLPWHCWHQLSPLLPELHWTRAWDFAERLRQGLLDRFIGDGWNFEKFSEFVRADEILRDILNSNALRPRHKEFLRELKSKARTHELSIAPTLRSLLLGNRL